MTIPLTGAGSLFVRLGHMIGASIANASSPNDLDYYVGTTLLTKINAIESDFNNGTQSRPTVEGLLATYSNVFNSVRGYISYVQGRCQQTITDMGNTDQGLPVQNPPASNSLQFLTALDLLITQMGSATASVQSSTTTLGSQTAVGTPHGNAILSLSPLDANGKNLQYAFAETLTFTCTNDSQSNSSLLGSEQLSAAGPPQVGDSLSPLWPGGSGVSGSLSCVDATKDVSSGNILTNSDFETWPSSSSPPTSWNLLSGSTANTDVKKNTSVFYTGLISAELTSGTASTTLSGIVQPFGASPGTSSTLVPNSVYAINFVDQVSAVPAAGVLEVALCDGSNSITQDNSGTQNKVQVTLSGESSTTFTSHQAFFRTPALTPATGYALRVRLSTAMDTGKSVYVDHLAMAYLPSPLYVGGPYGAAFSMSNKLLKGDQWTVAVGQTYGKFQKAFEQLFGMRQLGRVLPNAASPTVADSLIA